MQTTHLNANPKDGPSAKLDIPPWIAVKALGLDVFVKKSSKYLMVRYMQIIIFESM